SLTRPSFAALIGDMESVLTLIAAPGGLTESDVADLDPHWLAKGQACDVRCAYALARKTLAGKPVDILATKKRAAMLVTDMDSTIISEEAIDELALEVGLGDPIAAITDAGMCGRISFDEGFRQRIAMLAGTKLSVLDAVVDRLTPSPGACTLLATMKSQGAHCVLISGGLKPMAERIGKRLGFDRVYSNDVGIADGKLTGTVIGPILDAAGKRAALMDACRLTGIDPKQVIAAGDGMNDVLMLESVGIGIAFHPKPALASRIVNVVRYGDLTALLFVQGIAEETFIDNPILNFFGENDFPLNPKSASTRA
ncbi:MAG: phosphoserine phosphatase SerB, partial [Pseudomonadota bacterium]|nr:phosphoserine phosphatase SerB [Pseudomonadota bacterium]